MERMVNGRWLRRTALAGLLGWLLFGALATSLLGQDSLVEQDKPSPAAPPTKPDAAKPDATKPDATKPDATKPDPAKPEPAAPADPRAWLTLDLLTTRLADIEKSTDLNDEEKKAAKKLIDDAMASLRLAEASAGQLAQRKQMVETAPAETERIRKALADLDQTPPKPFEPHIADATTPKDIEQQLSDARNALKTAQDNLAKREEAVNGRKDLPASLRNLIGNSKAELEKNQKQLAEEAPPGEKQLLTQARRLAARASEKQLKAQVDLFEYRLLNFDAVTALETAQRDLAARAVPPAEQKVMALQEALALVSQREAQRAAEAAEKARQAAMDRSPALIKLLDANAADAHKAVELEKQRADLETELADKRKLLAALAEEFARVQAKVKDRGIDKRLARDLIRRRRTLPNPRELARAIKTLDEKAQMLELEQETLIAERKELDATEAKVKAIIDSLPPSMPAAAKEQVAAEARQAISKRKELTAARLDLETRVYQQERELIDVLGETLGRSDAFAAFITANLLWVADAEPVWRQPLKAAAEAFAWMISPGHWKELGTTLADSAADHAVLAAVMVLVIAALRLSRRRIRRRLDAIATQLKRIETDRFSLTPQALVLTLLLVLPVPLFFEFISILLRLSWSASDFTRAIAAGLEDAVGTWFAMRVALIMLKSDGLAESHLRWHESTTASLRHNLVWFILIAVPARFVITAMSGLDADAFSDSLGRLVFMGYVLAVAAFAYRVLHPGRGAVAASIKAAPTSLLARARHVWFALVLLVPVGLCVLAGIGYYYTARELGGPRLRLSVAALLSVLTLHSLLLRGLFVAQRRLALKQAKEKREARIASAAAGPAEPEGELPVPAEAPMVDLAHVSAQTRQLIRTGMTVLTVVSLYAIWAQVLPALRVLDGVRLWSHATVDGQPQYITLASVLAAALIGLVTFVASRNVPGLLEITILERTPLDAGGRYAFSTIARYVITAVGIALVFQAIGVGWSQVQWLVAAVSVGLGFGLQEIFANFVSGIIILFERPVRVGDVVTVGDVTGTVSRIRIRATTIVNFERKELIVPNKELITGRIMNWTLTDTVTRIELQVGVAYGSDTQLVQKLLLDCARANPLVMTDPPPVILFDSFGDSSLNFKMFVYVSKLADRTPVRTGLHEAVDRAFRSHGIEIPFPQRDLHVRTVDGSVVEAVARNGNGEAADAPQAVRSDDAPAPGPQAAEQRGA